MDEKHKTCTLTASGVKKAEAYFKVENLADADNMTLRHHIDQAIKAHGVMQRDIDYIVKDGEVIIVDEFTGRLMYRPPLQRRSAPGHRSQGRRDGRAESKTLATITFQNYFRMYKKLSGMTGTAKTEAAEFSEIYGWIVTVPTNSPAPARTCRMRLQDGSTASTMPSSSRCRMPREGPAGAGGYRSAWKRARRCAKMLKKRRH